MNIFEKFAVRLKERFCVDPNVVVDFGRPLEADGYWTFRMVFSDDYLVSIAWNRHRGFMLSTGYDIPYGLVFDEIYSSSNEIFERVSMLFEKREPTDFMEPVDLAELRKLTGKKQSDLAVSLAMTKGGLSQLENEDDLLSMKIGTIKKLVNSLGADLILTAQFDDGKRRVLSLS